jgi:RNA polymerase sigma factor (sigma-70 family)
VLTSTPVTIAPELLDADALFRAFGRYILAVANRRIEIAAPTDHAFDADDLAQESAIAIHRGRHYFRPERGRLAPWLAKMVSRTAYAVRKSATATRRGRCETNADERLARLPDPTAAEPVVSDFWAVIARYVTPTELRALVLRFEHELELKAIGARLGFKAACAWEVIKSALKKLHRVRFDLVRALGAND